jgi:hypothetical protein
MKINYRLCLMLVASAALGAAAVTSIKAQVKPPTYIVIDITEMSDPASFAKGVVSMITAIDGAIIALSDGLPTSASHSL